MGFKGFLSVVFLILLAFGGGYGLGYWKLHQAGKEWAAAKAEMQSKISVMEKELALAKAREKLWEMPGRLSVVLSHLEHKNSALRPRPWTTPRRLSWPPRILWGRGQRPL